MESIIEGIVEHNISSETFDAYLKKLKLSLDEAYSAGEQDKAYVAMMKLGEAMSYYSHIDAIWSKMTETQVKTRK